MLERNPNYTGGRPRRVERIVYTMGVKPADAISRVEQGRADYVTARIVSYDAAGPLAPGGTLDTSTDWRAGPAARATRATWRARSRGSTGSRSTRAGRSSVTRGCDARPRTPSTGARSPPSSASSRPTASSPRHRRARRQHRLSGRARSRHGAQARRPGAVRKATLYFCGDPVGVRIAEIVRANLAEIGIDVHIDQSLGCLKGPEPKRLAAADMQLVSRFDLVPTRRPFVELALGDRYTAPGYWRAARLQRRDRERPRACAGRAGPRPTPGSRRPSCATPRPSRSTRAA